MTVRHRTLLAGASAIALIGAAVGFRPAHASSLNALVSAGASARTGAASGLSGSQGLSQQTAAAATATKQSLQDMLTAAKAISAQAAAQASARLAAPGSEPAIPDGLGARLTQGLAPATDLDPTLTVSGAGVTDTGSGVVWYGASAPVQTQSGNQYTVTITQTSAKAILTWTNFDVGQNTTLVFNQTSNGVAQRDWIALNRVVGGSTSPSYILGKIQADGQVYIINQNGVIFGGTSQINVNSLVVSTLDIGSISANIVSSPATLAGRNIAFLSNDTDLYQQLGLAAPKITGAGGAETYQAGDITVEAGADIETPALSTSDTYLGRVLLAAPNVTNAGTIASPDGQVVLVSAVNLLAVANSAAATAAINGGVPSVDPNLRGIELAEVNNNIAIPNTYSYANPGVLQTSIVANSGLIQAPRGNITIEANDIELAAATPTMPAGVLETTTSVKENGSIYLTPQDVGGGAFSYFYPGTLNIGSGAVVAVLPDAALNADGSVPTIPESSITTAGYLPSVIEITLPAAYATVTNADGSVSSVQTGAATLDSGSLIEAPAANVTFYTPAESSNGNVAQPLTGLKPNLVIAGGAAIDVAGLTDIQHSVSDNIINVARVGLNELANSPLQRDGPIYRADVNIDARLGTPLFDASGYIADYALTAQDLAANGGTVKIGAAAGSFTVNGVSYAKGGIVAGSYAPSSETYTIAAVTAFEPGAVINVMGGYTTYAAGYLDTTKLVTADGDQIVDISEASPNVLYAGIAGTFTVDHARWGVTTTYNDLLFVNQQGTYDPGYVQGGNAGSVTIGGFAVLGGAIDAGAVQGTYQRAGSGIYASAPPTRGTIDLSSIDFTAIDIQAEAPTQAAAFSPDGTISFDSLLTQTIGADFLADSDAGAIKIVANGSISLDPAVAVTLAPATSLSFTAPSISVGAGSSITDPSGAIALTLDVTAISESQDGSSPTQTLAVGDNAVLNVAGNWVNDTGATVASLVGSDYVNGGAISIVSTQPDSGNIPIDTVSFGAGSRLDLDGGGYVTSQGHLAYGSNGLPLGKGGSLTIALHQTDTLFNAIADGNIALPVIGGVEQIDDSLSVGADFSLSAYGLAGGGSFLLQGPEITVSAVGDATLPTTNGATGQFGVSTAFLRNAGFGGYSLVAELTGRITAGTEVDLQQTQYLPTQNAASATSLTQAVTLGMNTGIVRPATNFSFSGLGWIDGATAYADQTNVTDKGVTYSSGGFGSQIAGAALTVGDGALINADPGASVSLSATGSLTFDGAITAPGGTIRLSQINDYAAYFANDSTAYVDYFGALTLGPNAVLNAQGVLVIDPRQQLYQAGSVLAGGSVTLSGTEITGETGSVIDVAGASGTLGLPTSDALSVTPRQAETVTSDGGQIVFTGPADFTTNGAGLIYGQIDTTFEAAGGGGASAGGALDITADFLALQAKYGKARVAASQQTIDQQGLKVALGSAPSGPAFSVARIDAGDFDVVDLRVYDQTGQRGSDTLSIANNVDLTANRLLEVTGFNVKMGAKNGHATLSAPYVEWLGDGTLADTGALGPSSATLTIQAADALEIGGYTTVKGVSSLVLSAGEIAFIPDTATTTGEIVYGGQLVSNGGVTLNAGTVYASTGTGFTIETVGSVTFENTTGIAPIAPLSVGGAISVEAADISVLRNATIVAPYGQIDLGALTPATADDPYFTPTANVTLASGSLVTVSGADQLLPYGQTENLRTWLYGALGAISSAPAKAVAIDAASADVASGAKIDLSGGGDIFAYEFVTGLGGTNNVLSAAPTNGFSVTYASNTVSFAGAAVANAPAIIDITLPGGASVSYTTTNSDTPATIAAKVAALVEAEGVKATVSGGTVSATGVKASLTGYTGTVYAIAPGYQGLSAPVDVSGYADPNNLADPALGAIGRTVTLNQAVDGLAAGTYLLLPVAYADLAGAVRVEISPSTTNIAGNSVESALDGTITVAGTLGYAGSQGVANGSRSSENVAVSLQTAPVWNQYSEINITTGNQYFAALAAASGAYVPPLPADAGQLSIDVTDAASGLTLDRTLDFAPGTDGRGGQLYIGAPTIEVVSDDQTADPGVLALTPAEIADFGAPRVTLGAIGQTTAAGETLDVVAQSIVVRTDADDPLVASEITLAAKGGITVDDGSVIDADGALAASGAGAITIGAVGGASGDGALIRVSNAGPATITRANVGNLTGAITFGDSVTIGGDSVIGVQGADKVKGAAAVEIDGTSAVTLPVSSTITAGAIDISGQRTSFTAGAATTGGVQINDFTGLEEASSVIIQASQAIVFDAALAISPASFNGSQSFTLDTPSIVFVSGAGGGVSIAANDITLTNSFAANSASQAPTGLTPAPSGALTLNAIGSSSGAGTLNITGASHAIYGFNQVALNAGGEVLTGAGGDSGTFLVEGGDLAITAPLITAANASYQIIQASGAITLSAPAGGPAAVSTANIGGHIQLIGDSITVGADISAVSGEIDLTARGAGGIAITGAGSLNAQGFAEQYLASASGGTETVLPGGTIQLEANSGNITLAEGSVVDVAAAPGGNAGAISITIGSPEAVLTLATSLLGHSGGGATSGGGFSLDTTGAADLTALVPLLVDGGFTNSVSIESGVGNLILNQTLTARQVLLSADDASGTGGGSVILNATIDASGNSADGEGGTVQIYGASGVTLASGAAILARSTDPSQRGGQVTIGVGVDAEGNSGVLNLAAGSTIDVTGGARSYGSDGGMILFRTPFVNADGVTAWTGGAGAASIATATALDATLIGAGTTADGTPNVTLEPYQRIDVATLYAPNSSGVSTIGDWTPVFQVFAPQTTALAAQYAGMAVMPGLELDDATGSVAITANLDLAATTTAVVTNTGGAPVTTLVPTYRYGAAPVTVQTTVTGGNPADDGTSTATEAVADMPGILTIRAAGNIDLEATISDGFTFTPNNAEPGGSDINAAADLEQQGPVTATGARTVTYTRGRRTVTGTETIVSTYSANPLLESWSYQFVAGARFNSGTEGGDPVAVAQATTFQTGPLASQGNFIMGSAPTLGAAGGPGLNSVLLRTGTGSIGIYAGGEGIGTQGVDSILATLTPQEQLYDAAAGFHVDADAAVLLLNPGAAIYTAGYDAAPAAPTSTTDGFDGYLYPYLIGEAGKEYENGFNLKYDGGFINPTLLGANWNAPSFDTMGGDITISAPHGGIVAQQNFHDIIINGSGALDPDLKTPNSDHTLLTSDSNGQLLNGSGGDANNLGETSAFWLNGQGTTGGDPAVWVDTGMFREGVGALGGGDVSVTAGGDIRDIAVSIVSTYFVEEPLRASAAAKTINNNGYGYGGGNLTVAAGNDISSIVTQVEEGNTNVSAGGGILSNADIPQINTVQVGAATEVSSVTSLAIGSDFTWSEGSVTVVSRGAIDGVDAPWEGSVGVSGLFIDVNQFVRDAYSLYSPTLNNSLTIIAEGGDLDFTDNPTGSTVNSVTVTPPTVTLASVSGSVDIVGGLAISPASTGNLDILAQDSVYYWADAGFGAIQFTDLDPTLVQSPTNTGGAPLSVAGSQGTGYFLDYTSAYASTNLEQTNYTLHDADILHAGDTEPFRIIALTGDIATGVDPTGAVNTSAIILPNYYASSFAPEQIYADKPGVIFAGRDIVNMSFAGENNAAGDTTLVEAGRDITYTTYSISINGATPVATPAGSNFIIGGPGIFDMIAGRDINLEPSDSEDSPVLAGLTVAGSGVQAVGDGINPWLPATSSAQINILYGVSPGIDNGGFIAAYLDPATAGAYAATYDPLLQGYVQTLEGSSTTPTVAGALTSFDALTSEAQLPLLEQVLFDEIRIVSNPDAPDNQYQNFTRAYDAINALFPYSYGYTNDFVRNPKTGKHNMVATGDFDMTNAVVSTRYASDINVLGPGGGTTVGGLSALGLNGNVIPVDEQGILAISGGAINALVDTDFNVFSSRVLALDGGEITIASVNGSIDAGRGKKTVSLVPPLTVDYTPDLSAYIDPAGQITGSGIGTLVTIPGEAQAPVYLLAPNGDIDAGDAGVRSSGNIYIVALTVLNGDNFNAGGHVSGIPTAPTISIGALNAANASSASATNANNVLNQNAPAAQRVPSIITVEFLGFGEVDAEPACVNQTDPKCRPGKAAP